MTRVLVTGFEPFGGAEANPSQLLVEALSADPPEGIELEAAVLPVSYARAAGALRDAVRAAEPELVVCFGQADGNTGLSVERFALNLDDAGATDNEGVAGAAGPIDPDGPVAYRSGLPVDEIVAAVVAEVTAGVARRVGGDSCLAQPRLLRPDAAARAGAAHGSRRLRPRAAAGDDPARDARARGKDRARDGVTEPPG
jgi:pyroglutamyl-peptidase